MARKRKYLLWFSCWWVSSATCRASAALRPPPPRSRATGTADDVVWRMPPAGQAAGAPGVRAAHWKSFTAARYVVCALMRSHSDGFWLLVFAVAARSVAWTER